MAETTTSTRDLLARRRAAVARGVAVALPLIVEEGSGAVLRDHRGRRVIDFAGGIGCLNVGHTHPAVVAAIARQAARLTHACFQVATYEPYVAVAEALNAIVPGPGPKKTLLVNTGAEAVENAVKIARVATGRPAVVAFEHAFHGRTLLGMTLTGKVHPYKAGFGPFAPEIYRLPFPYCFRCPRKGASLCCFASPEAITTRLATAVAPESVAAIVIEPVAGEGGFIPVPSEVLRAHLVAWQSRHPWIGDVRGLGAMQAIELVDPEGEPDGARAATVQREAASRGLLVLTAGTFGNVIRLLMPLTIPRDVLDEGLATLAAALAAADGTSTVQSGV